MIRRHVPAPRVPLKTRIRRPGWLFAAFFLAACSPQDLPRIGDLASFAVEPAAGPADALDRGDELLVAEATSGEPCRARKIGEDEAARIDDFAVFCGGWERPAGWFHRFPAGGTMDPVAILDDPQLVPWPAGSMRCGTVQRPSPEEAVAFRRCVSGDGWPMLAWAAIAPRGIGYAGHGLAHLGPVFDAIRQGRSERVRAGTRTILARHAALLTAGGVPDLDRILRFRTLVELGRLHNQAGEFAAAGRVYERALDLQRRGQGGDRFTAELLAALGLNHASEGRMADAERAFAAAGKQLEEIAWSDAYPRILTYRAIFHRMRGELDAASRDIGQAIRAWRRLRGPRSSGTAHAEFVAAGIRLAEGRNADARRLLENVRAYQTRHHDYVGLLFTRLRLAELAYRDGRLRLAENHGREAERLAGLLFGDGLNLADARFLQARILLARGDRRGAAEALKKGARTLLARAPNRAALRASMLEEYLHALAELAGSTSDGRILRDGRVVELAQLIRDPTYDVAVRRMASRILADRKGLRPAVQRLQELASRRRALQLALGRIRLRDAFAPPDAEEAALRQELRRLAEEQRTLEDELQARFPRYGRLVSTLPVGRREIARALLPGEAVLQFVVTRDASFALLLRRDGTVLLHRSDLGRRRLADAVRRLRRALTLEEGIVPFDMKLAHELYRTLLGEAMDRELDGLRHLVLVPDGALASLPFGVLLREPAAPGNYREAAWVARDLALSAVPSVRSFLLLRTATGPSSAERPFLGVGDPLLQGQGRGRGAVRRAIEACVEEGRYDPAILRALPALPETRAEIQRVRDLLGRKGSKLLTGARAREAIVRRTDLKRYRILSFATHGLLPGELPCRNEPGLVLTPPNRARAEDDGLLSGSEIARLDLDADWVVLSACNTVGPDGVLGGASLNGLSAAFFHAGARTLLASHWDVASEPTVALMTSLFRSYARAPQLGKAEALRRARIRLMQDPERAHPVFWGAFVLIGDGGARPPQV